MGRVAGAVTIAVALMVGLSANPSGAQFDAKSLLLKAWSKKDAIAKGAKALRKGFSDLTDEEEYYIGRAVAAKILSDFKPVKDKARTAYLNTLGQILARYSTRPETFAGYHFALVESKDVNAFAAPGGFIFITTGLYSNVKSEEQLACVLAHEIAHVTLKHGLGAIKSANLTQAFTIIGTEAAKEYSPSQVGQLTEAFAGSIDDIVNKMVVSGYSRGQEYDADKEALRIAYSAGYDPSGLVQFLKTLAGKSKKGGGAGFYNTHPPADKRASKAEKFVSKKKMAGSEDPARTKRFKKYAL